MKKKDDKPEDQESPSFLETMMILDEVYQNLISGNIIDLEGRDVPAQKTTSSFKILAIDDLNILIEDLDWGRSVTNDAANVIAELSSIVTGGIGNRRVYYRDTGGRFDQLCVKNGRFSGFAPCTQGQQQAFGRYFPRKIKMDSK